MFGSYSRGTDLPPLLRDSLLADETAAAGFNSLDPAAQRDVVSGCAKMSSSAQIDEYIRQTDNFLFTDITCGGISEQGSGLL
ncbi:MAG: hypothetical protein IKO27_00155 [Ruminococcus sp.]|nr:hypothetical protein [Ruminococcus sp.]